MPELPEVETVARQLSPLLAGRTLRELRVFDRKLEPLDASAVVGRTVRSVRRRGKHVVIELSRPRAVAIETVLLVHLRMTGRLLWRDDGSAPHDRRHVRAALIFDTGAVDYVDPRRFGTIRIGAPEGLGSLCGLEPLDLAFDARRLTAILSGSRQEIKPWLLRQDRIAGIGNIYACEVLHAARLSPWRRVGTLTAAEVRRLHGAIRRTLAAAIELCGTTFSDFQDVRGRSGGFARRLRVYGRQGLPCPACGGPVARVAQQGRGTFHCPRCQA